MATQHPSDEELMLWHSRELDSARDRTVAAHVERCSKCQRDIAELDRVLGLAGQVSDRIAAARRLESVAAVRRKKARKLGVSVGLLIACSVVLVLLLTREVKVARADDILEKAVDAERLLDSPPSAVYLASHEIVCPLDGPLDSVSTSSSAPTESSPACTNLTKRLRSAGWMDSPLSAAAYRQWRARLSGSKDIINQHGAVLILATEAKRGPLLSVEMHVRVPTYRVLEFTFRFSDEHGIGTELMHVAAVGPAILPPPRLAPNPPLSGISSKSGATTLRSPAEQQSVPSAVDIAELRVRQVLRQWQLDRDVLFAIERTPEEVGVRGVIESPSDYQAIARELEKLAPLRIEVSLPGDPSAVPWKTFQGDIEPAAFDRLNELFPDSGSQRELLVNSMTTASRRVAGTSRMYEETMRLAERLTGAPERAEAETLMQELANQIFQDKQEIARGLATLIGPVSVSDHPLSAEQGRRLYDLVHMLVFMGQSGSTQSVDEISQGIIALLDTP